MSVRSKKYTKEYKTEAVKLAKEIGTTKAATELGIPKGTLGGWMYAARQGELDLGIGTQTPESGLTLVSELKKAKEQIKLQEKEMTRLRKINEFLEEASRFFASGQKK